MRPIVNMEEEDRVTDIGNMNKTFGKHRACGSGDILADRQTDRHTHRQAYSSQYFATAPAGEVMSKVNNSVLGYFYQAASQYYIHRYGLLLRINVKKTVVL